MTKWLGLILACLTCFAILYVFGCVSTGSGGSSGYSQKDVQYTVDCSAATCTNPDNQATGETTSGSTTIYTKTCMWFCGNYKGQTKKAVSLSFSKTGLGCWALLTETIVDSSICR